MSAAEPPHQPPHKPPRRRHTALISTGLFLLAVIGAAAVCEWQGWPMLRRPAENWASKRLQREVSFAGSGTRWQLHLLGGIRLNLGHLEVGGPDWGTVGATLVASEVKLALRYRDVFAYRRGEPLKIASLEAQDLSLRAQRLADGRASWQFGPTREPSERSAVEFESLRVKKGMAIVDDRLSALSMVANFAVLDGMAPDGSREDIGIRADAEGRFRNAPLKASLRSGSTLPWLSSDPKAPAVDVVFKVESGQAGLDFKGQVRDLLASQGLSGDYSLRGPSLAAVGQPLGITLPTTPPFAMNGSLVRDGPRWKTHVRQATIGKSSMNGDFVFDRSAAVPKLSGELHSPELWLADLGPAIGTSGAATQAAEAPRQGMGPARAVRVAATTAPARTAGPGRVLPDRAFDLPSLRAMNADVRMDIARLDSGNAQLQSIQPLRTHLILQDGVLTLDDIDARLAQGLITGRVTIDGREAAAVWRAQLGLRGMLLEQWLLLRKGSGASATPYATGRIGAKLDIEGRGRSTAQFLASANGRAQLFWNKGTVSHLLVEGAGIDIAQALGIWVKGDDALPVTCAIADMRATDGMIRPQYFVVDTPDSALRVEGGLSLATERLGLVLHVAPKDISPLALRTPVDVNGTFGKPDISLQKGPMAKRLVPAVALGAVVTPLAALLPLIDLGDKTAQVDAEQCRAGLARYEAEARNSTAAVGQR